MLSPALLMFAVVAVNRATGPFVACIADKTETVTNPTVRKATIRFKKVFGNFINNHPSKACGSISYQSVANARSDMAKCFRKPPGAARSTGPWLSQGWFAALSD